ncbi:MAG: hypothetical protein ABH834_01025 [Candidatus Altiarchaeota archaeon]
MEVNIIDKKDNPLLERTEAAFEVSFAGATPSFAKVRKEVIAKLKSKDKLTIISSVQQGFGEHTARGKVKVYANEEAMKVEPAHKIKKNFEVKEEAPAEAAPEQAPPTEAAEAPAEAAPDQKPLTEAAEAPAEAAPAQAPPPEDSKEEKPAEGEKPQEQGGD